MDTKTAAILLASLLERIEHDRTVGTASSLERQALQLAVQVLGGQHESAIVVPDKPVATTMASPASASTPAEVSQSRPARANQVTTGLPTPAQVAPVLSAVPAPAPARAASVPEPAAVTSKPPEVELVLAALQRGGQTPANMLMCLDFGTAMSKAFASVFPGRHLDLELGVAAGGQGYALPSSMYISSNGRAYFGFEAIDKSLGAENAGRERLDSIKGWISMQEKGTLDEDSNVLGTALNPTAVRLTQGDVLRIYLAYLTDMAAQALSAHLPDTDSRYIKRRYARPSWSASKAQWGDRLMRRMLAEAQILADTFGGQWAGGIDVALLKKAIEKTKRLGQYPDYLVEAGVPEPVAVAAGEFIDSDNLRDPFMVVDVGAGTTDFGLFVSVKKSTDDEPRVFQIAQSIKGLMQAGDKVDGLLRGFIAHKERIDASDNAGKLVLANLTSQIRSLKELLFRTGELEYTLSDDTVGRIQLQEFLGDEKVLGFGKLVEKGFQEALQGVHDSWLQWLALPGVRLHVVITGGSSPLPMMQALGKGSIVVKGHRIERLQIDPKPLWMHEMPEEFAKVYPQLAVAIGGAAEAVPETLDAPEKFAGGIRQHSYVAGATHADGA